MVFRYQQIQQKHLHQKCRKRSTSLRRTFKKSASRRRTRCTSVLKTPIIESSQWKNSFRCLALIVSKLLKKHQLALRKKQNFFVSVKLKSFRQKIFFQKEKMNLTNVLTRLSKSGVRSFPNWKSNDKPLMQCLKKNVISSN